jgi:transcriptional regulator with XRE-family HTH domain
MIIKAVFGSNLKYYRKQKGFSQEKLSEKLKITPKHLSAIETGTTFVSSELLEKLMDSLEVPAAALFYMPGQRPDEEILLKKYEEVVKNILKNTAEEITARLKGN